MSNDSPEGINLGQQLVEEGLDHVAIRLADNLELGPHSAESLPGEDSPPLSVLPLLLLAGPVPARLGGAVHQQLPGLSRLPLQAK